MKVNFINFKNIFLRKKISKMLNFALEESAIEFNNFFVNIIIVNEEEIRKLNKENRNNDKVTDVLSFPYFDLNKGKNFDYKLLNNEIDPSSGLVCLGEIAICYKRAKEQALSFGHSFKREICFLSVHGFLHLLGYDHLKEEEEVEMNTFANKVLDKFKIGR